METFSIALYYEKANYIPINFIYHKKIDLLEGVNSSKQSVSWQRKMIVSST